MIDQALHVCKYTTFWSGQSSGAHKKVISIWSLPNTLPCWVRSPAPPLRRDFGNRSGKEFETFLGRLGWMTSNSQWGSNLQSFGHALPTELSLINQHQCQWWLSYLYPRVMGESQTCQPKFFKMCDPDAKNCGEPKFYSPSICMNESLWQKSLKWVAFLQKWVARLQNVWKWVNEWQTYSTVQTKNE